MAAAIGAVGLTLLVGVAGQLSLGHAAFAAIGAYVYVWATSDSTPTLAGAGLPPVVGLVLAVGAAALVGVRVLAGRRAGSVASTSGWPPSAWSSWCGTCCSTSTGGRGVSPGARWSRSRSAASASATRTPTTSPSRAWSSRGCTGSGTCSSSSPCWPPGWPPICAPAGPVGPGRTSGTARPPRRPWGSPSPGTRRRPSSCPPATPGSPGRSSRWRTAGSHPTCSASPCRSTSWS